MFEINRTALNQNSFKVAVQIKGVTNILLLNVPYIAIDPNFPHHINSFDNVPANYSAGKLVNISTPSTSMRTYTNTINYGLQAAGRNYTSFNSPWSRNKILLFMTSLFLYGDNEQAGSAKLRSIDLFVDAKAISKTKYQIIVKFGK